MNAPELFKRELPDTQGSEDLRHLAIQRVGIKRLKHPLQVAARGAPQATIGEWSFDVYLPETKKGTHMSRFVALLESERAPFDANVMRAMLTEMVERLNAPAGQIEVSFPLFIKKAAPVSEVLSVIDVEVRLSGSIADAKTRVALTVVVPVTTLCPCSKEISAYGAHNQRSHVTIRVDLAADIDAEELVDIAEAEASSPLYGMLKRVDEKFVTEHAYENPKFVEDLVRDVVRRLQNDPRFDSYVVEVENFESIHNHSAYARIESPEKR
jgi:GTP cyclohydrolase I